MEKYLVKWTYWLGLACALIAFVMRGLNGVGIFLDFLPGANIGHMGFYKAAFLLLAIAIASATSMQATSQKQQ